MEKELLQTAEKMITTLRGTVEGLWEQLRESEEREEELANMVAKLEAEKAALQEQLLRKEAVESEPVLSPKETDLFRVLANKLNFYYCDMEAFSRKHLTTEDSETMYHMMEYTYKVLKKAGVPFQKK